MWKLSVAVRARCVQKCGRGARCKKQSSASTLTESGGLKISRHIWIGMCEATGKVFGGGVSLRVVYLRKSPRGAHAERRVLTETTRTWVLAGSWKWHNTGSRKTATDCTCACKPGKAPTSRAVHLRAKRRVWVHHRVPRTDLPGAAGELERGGWVRPVRVERRGCSPREVSSSPHTCKRVNEKTNRGTRRSALLNCWLKTTL